MMNNFSLADQVESIVVEHCAYKAALNKLHDVYDNSIRGSRHNSVAIIGESGTGKSTLIYSLLAEAPRRKHNDGWYIPILYLALPNTPNLKNTYEQILRALGDPLYSKGTLGDKLQKILVLLKACQTKIIIIDEYQRLIDRQTKKKILDISEMAKDFMDMDIGIIVSGLPSCEPVILESSQFKRRMLSSVYLKRFNISKTRDTNEFKSILDSYQKTLEQSFKNVPMLSSPHFVNAFFCASGGFIGYVSKIITQTVINAIKSKKRSLDWKDFSDAWKYSVPDHTVWNHAGDPFSPTFELAQIPNYVKLAHEVGWDEVRNNPNYTKQSRRRVTPSQVFQK
ncbi:TniB family NTP-binding protein [Methylobacillus caricis]|uniref:TniB family NTP-binding protein n=1 Tax=Methylobacillus caricis TaxID=1971611 RepID=UPI001CFFA316|nr:TniB family NTP-binding protein [Methylobacillus caricis]MCB5188867.1 TniB family NTP-binding protein [Methylobacillus caricis]